MRYSNSSTKNAAASSSETPARINSPPAAAASTVATAAALLIFSAAAATACIQNESAPATAHLQTKSVNLLQLLLYKPYPLQLQQRIARCQQQRYSVSESSACQQQQYRSSDAITNTRRPTGRDSSSNTQRGSPARRLQQQQYST